MRLTSNQWKCLLAASRGDAYTFHGNAIGSLQGAGLLTWVGFENGGFVPTPDGRRLLGSKFPTAEIGENGMR